MSLPLRERGLKSSLSTTPLFTAIVAPLAGAWIEIGVLRGEELNSVSLPLRERGLKFYGLFHIPLAAASLPLRERGLKSTTPMHYTPFSPSLPLRERGLK